MGILVDSSELIVLERQRSSLESLLTTLKDEPVFLSVVSASELLHGVARAKDVVTRTRRSAFVEAILASIPILPIDLVVARVHAELWASLSSRGTMIGINDSWIAATCIAFDLDLLTGNEKEFRRVTGLKLRKL